MAKKIETGQLWSIILYAGLGLAIGGLIVGSIFNSAVTTVTDAFTINSTHTNYSNATPPMTALGGVVNIVWVLSFLLLFLVAVYVILKKVGLK